MENAVTASGARIGRNIADAVAGAASSQSDEVKEGSVIKAVFVEMWVKSNADAGQDTKFQLLLEKIPAGQTGVTFTQMNTLMSYPNKKNVLFYSQGVVGDLTTQAIPVVRQWFLIPKGKQRFGLGDRLVVNVSATAFGINSCGFSVYKEYQ